MRDKIFWIDTAERAVKTFAQALLAVLVVGVPAWEIDWVSGLGVALTAALASVVSSVASSGVGAADSASVVPQAGPHSEE